MPGNLVLTNPDYGLFVGRLVDNKAHRHYAIQITIELTQPIVMDNYSVAIEKGMYLNWSNEPHSIQSAGEVLVLLINPFSKLAHGVGINGNQPLFLKDFCIPIKNQALLYLKNKQSSEFSKAIQAIMEQLSCVCRQEEHWKDHRVFEVVEYLSTQQDRTVPLLEMAERVHLSPSRLLHLFKSQTGLTFRRAQLWYRIRASINRYNTLNLTQIAHEFGFTDSAHYNRTYKEHFGFSPKELMKNSQFIQV